MHQINLVVLQNVLQPMFFLTGHIMYNSNKMKTFIYFIKKHRQGLEIIFLSKLKDSTRRGCKK